MGNPNSEVAPLLGTSSRSSELTLMRLPFKDRLPALVFLTALTGTVYAFFEAAKLPEKDDYQNKTSAAMFSLSVLGTIMSLYQYPALLSHKNGSARNALLVRNVLLTAHDLALIGVLSYTLWFSKGNPDIKLASSIFTGIVAVLTAAKALDAYLRFKVAESNPAELAVAVSQAAMLAAITGFVYTGLVAGLATSVLGYVATSFLSTIILSTALGYPRELALKAPIGHGSLHHAQPTSVNGGDDDVVDMEEGRGPLSPALSQSSQD